jgi:hypothetical protein
MPHGGTFVDFGCGTGIATRMVLERVESRRVHLLDRSPEAARFAAGRVAESSARVEIVLEAPRPDEPIDVLLASHVLDELDERGRDELLALARRARILVWVEAGSLATSRALSAIRDELLDVFDVLAPCTHRESCPALRSERDWCHFFAKPPAEVFTSAGWRRFATELGLDLRSLPYSFVALRRGEKLEHGGARVLGRPRVLKGRAVIDVCDASGLHARTLLERTDRDLFRRLAKGGGEPRVLDLELEGGRVVRATPRGEPR